MPEHDPEQELGPKFASAFQNRADATEVSGSRMAAVARGRVRRRRQAVMSTAAAVLVVVAIGGAWNLTGSSSMNSETAGSAGDSKGATSDSGVQRTPEGVSSQPIAPQDTGCPAAHPILKAPATNAVPAGTGLDVSTPVSGLLACRYDLKRGALLGQQTYSPAIAQQVVDAIKPLPEMNSQLPVFKCAPQTAQPSEAIVLRFTTAAGIREIWVEYTGCNTPGFFTGSHTYGLFAAPLKLFMTGPVRPAGSTYLDALTGW
ncbi:hypothetical protein GCM10029976_073160 [Kribbella albertanoniae]|uniref:Uncharacterized protein n=1 Tax=Kribbella albertanoniae TaxID=1266829 RepID=A0A4R4QF07_9ACTN|nr:hypothetical protein [Kribbella albertanoniae]TDC33809.1 hypothetical protein E1261_05020 [Kribbella albertanoniae]